MQLETQQSALGTLLLQEAGYDVLNNEARWKGYIETAQGQRVAAYPRERLALYEELLFNTIEDTMQGFFPFCKHFIRDQWIPVIEGYRRACPNTSYYLYKIGEAFPEFLARQTALVEKYPFLPDLAQYQWLEVDIYNAPNVTYPANFQAELPWSQMFFETAVPFWNPVSRLARFKYPVTSILRQLNALIEEYPEADDLPLERIEASEEPMDILIYRDPETHEVRFFELNVLTSALIQTSAQATSFINLFQTLHETLPALQGLALETVVVEGVKLIQHCQQEKILLGACH